MEHQRIDEGVDRPAHAQPAITRALEGDSWTIPDGLDPDAVLLEYLTAGKTSGIAQRYGIRRGALTRWLQGQRPEQWKQIQIIRALCTKEDGQEEIYDAGTALQLARARELVRAAQWDLERLDSANYGQKQEITHTIQPVLVINTGPVATSAEPIGPLIAVDGQIVPDDKST